MELSNKHQLREFLAKYDNFILDCDGVLWRGGELLPNVGEYCLEGVFFPWFFPPLSCVSCCFLSYLCVQMTRTLHTSSDLP